MTSSTAQHQLPILSRSFSYAKPVSKLKLPNVYRILLYTGGLICGVWATFHLFSYSRQFFEGLTTFDIVFIATMLPLGLYIAYNYNTRPTINIVLGFFGMAICGYFGIFNTPFSNFPDQAPVQEFFFGLLRTEMGAPNFGFVLLFSIILVCGIFQFWGWERICRQNTMHQRSSWRLNMVVSFMFSLGFYIGIIFGFDHSLESPFYCMAFVSSGMLFVMGLIPGKIPQAYFSQKERILMEEIQAKPDLSMSTRVMRRFSLSLTWITTTFYVLLTAFLYQKFTDVGDRVLTIMSFLECLLIGFSIVLIANMNPKISRALKWIATAVMPIAVWRLAVQGLSGTLEPFSVEAGIAFSFAIWVYMSRAAKYSKVKLAGAWIVLTLLVSAYLAFIPSKAPEIERIASQVDVYLTVVVAIDIVSILLIKNVPEIFDHRNYILLVPDEAKKPAVIDVILERVKKFLDLTLTKLDPRSDEKGDTPRERTIEYKGKEENAESGSEEAKNTNETPKGGEYTKEEI